MRSGWLRWAAFFAAIGALVAFVTVATWNEPQSTELLVTEAAFIGVVAYLVTHLIWPRSHRGPASTHPSRRQEPSPVPIEPGLADHDPRPVLVIGDRPAGSRPGSRVHVRDTPTMRATRGRRPGPRSQRQFQWPAQR